MENLNNRNVNPGARFALTDFGYPKEVKVVKVSDPNSRRTYVTYSSLGQLSGIAFGCLQLHDFLSRERRLRGYRFQILGAGGTEEIVVEANVADSITAARRAASERGHFVYMGFAYAD